MCTNFEAFDNIVKLSRKSRHLGFNHCKPTQWIITKEIGGKWNKRFLIGRSLAGFQILHSDWLKNEGIMTWQGLQLTWIKTWRA
jgi:hypothetical protein